MCYFASVVIRSQAPTLTEELANALRIQLTTGDIAPGTWLRPAELAKTYGVSPGVMRDAISRLADHGLTTQTPNRGFQVVSLGIKEIQELTQMRKICEGSALRLAIELGDRHWEAGFLSAHHLLTQSTVPSERSAAHRQFHFSLIAGCGNSRLLRQCEDLFDAAEIYRQWAQRAMSGQGGLMEQSRYRDEHAEILKASLNREADLALEILVHHLEHTQRLAIEFLSHPLESDRVEADSA